MSRIAVIIANSVSGQPTQRAQGSSKVRRTIRQFTKVLTGLPDKFAFDVRSVVDGQPAQARTAVARAASKCRKQGDLLLVYYFGHARRQDDDLALVHPEKGKDKKAYLEFTVLFHTVMAGAPKTVLFLIDCCYAGAAGRPFELLPSGSKHCLMACTTPSTRAYWEERLESPIGFFTGALIDGLSGPRATVGSTNKITAGSLFDFVQKETKERTGNMQEPYMLGNSTETLSLYTPRPAIVPGTTEDISPKCGYRKMLATVLTIGGKRFDELRHLYTAVVSRYRESFLTNSRDEKGRQKLANWTSLRRYVAFLREIRVIDEEELRLTARGLCLIEDPARNYNVKLLKLLTEYLGRQDGLTVDHLRDTMQRVLQRKWLPTRENVLQDLSQVRRGNVHEGHIGLVLDLLGYIGMIGTLRKREQVYFPWIETADVA